MKYCKVKNCKFPTFHITKGHICGSCGVYGHGVIECKKPEFILQLDYDDTVISVNLHCIIDGCTQKDKHISDGHHCLDCNKYGHGKHECPNKLWKQKKERNTTFNQYKKGYKEKQNLKIRARNKIGLNKNNVYTIMYGGMGCMWYAKRNNYGKISLFFMHSDCWGQYGPDSDMRPQLKTFLEDYQEV
jgi:hypothetical protein